MDDPTSTSQDHLENGLTSLPSKKRDANYVSFFIPLKTSENQRLSGFQGV